MTEAEARKEQINKIEKACITYINSATKEEKVITLKGVKLDFLPSVCKRCGKILTEEEAKYPSVIRVNTEKGIIVKLCFNCIYEITNMEVEE